MVPWLGISVGLVLLAAIGALRVLASREDARVQAVWDSLAAPGDGQVFDASMMADLPEAAQRYFAHAIAPGTPLSDCAIVTLHGQLRDGPEAPWIRMQAREVLRPGVGFVWSAKAKMGIIPLRGADQYVDGVGMVRFRVAGLVPLINLSGEAASRSCAGRLMAEAAFCPGGLLRLPEAKWEAVGSDQFRVSTTIHGTPVAAVLRVRQDGSLSEIVVDRYDDSNRDPEAEYVPFGATFRREATFGGYTVPAEAVAGWLYGTARYSEDLNWTIDAVSYV